METKVTELQTGTKPGVATETSDRRQKRVAGSRLHFAASHLVHRNDHLLQAMLE